LTVVDYMNCNLYIPMYNEKKEQVYKMMNLHNNSSYESQNLNVSKQVLLDIVGQHFIKNDFNVSLKLSK
jgi:hypothetical protein